MKWRVAKLGLCPCGFPVLDESVPLGTEYEVTAASILPFTLICGGCGREHKIHAIWAESRYPGNRPGYLPVDLFDKGEKYGESKLPAVQQ